MIQLTMKISLFEDGIPLNMSNEIFEIELSHPQAAQMAGENVVWQADDTYFAASLEIRIDDKQFFKQFITDAFLYVHTDYEWDENDFLVSMTKTTISSDPLQKIS